MPLLTSPIDGSPMKQIHRFGIELDVCPTSGGIWLDKGELEKLMALIREAAEEESQQRSARSHGRDDEDDRYERPGNDSSHKHGGKHKKEGAFSQIMELFEF